VHHLFQKLLQRLGGLSHHIFDLISQFTVHVPFELIHIEWSSIILDNIFAVVSLIEHQLELSEVIASNQRLVVILPQKSLR
jgi:hypothetical protein